MPSDDRLDRVLDGLSDLRERIAKLEAIGSQVLTEARRTDEEVAKIAARIRELEDARTETKAKTQILAAVWSMLIAAPGLGSLLFLAFESWIRDRALPLGH